MITGGSVFYLVNHQRVRKNVAWLNSIQAEYTYASDVSSVDIIGSELDDAQLERLDSLKQLKSLAISSNLATDSTIKRISNLPNLTRLTLTGERFTFLGLLHLRKLVSLESLVLNGMALSNPEICVLESALPDVHLSYDCEGGAFQLSQPVPGQFTLIDHEFQIDGKST